MKNLEKIIEDAFLKEMRSKPNVYESIKWAETQIGVYPVRPTKPNLPNKHTSDEVKEYTKKLELWESQMMGYEDILKKCKERSNVINTLIEKFIKKESGFDLIPEEYQDKIWSKAYSDGHSSGLYGVYLELTELVDIFG